MKKVLALLLSISLLGVGTATANVGAVVDDSAITETVKVKIAASPIVSSAPDIKVETNKGIVALQGNVKTVAEADTAIEIASSVEGVSDVDTSGLQVKGNQHPLDDSIITAKIKGIYLREKLFGNGSIAVMSIHVTTSDGIVYLTGEASKDQANNAQRLTKSIKGVKEVKSDLRLK